MSPLNHLPGTDDVIDEMDDAVDAVAHLDPPTSREQRPPEHMFTTADLPHAEAAPVVTPLAKIPDLVDAALENLRDAVLSGSVEAIQVCQEKLENARTDALRAHQRRADLQKAEAEANKMRIAAQQKAQRELSDHVEKKVRARAPKVQFVCPGNRTVTVTLGGLDLEVQESIEAVRRLAYATAMCAARQIQASRQAGRVVSMTDFLTAMLSDESGGIATALRKGLARVSKTTTKKGNKK